MPQRVIIASAGSGKTQRLAQLAIETLISEKEPRGVLAITFTRNAAAELRNRILSLLIQEAAASPYHQCLARLIILGQVPLYTQTIDSLVRELYHRIAPMLGVAVYDHLIVEEEEYIEIAHTLSQAILTHHHSPETKRLLLLSIQKEIEERARRIDPENFLQRQLFQLTREGPLKLTVRKALYHAILSGRLDNLNQEWREALSLDKREALFIPLLIHALERYREEHQRLFLSDISALVQLTARHLGELIAEHAAFYSHLLVDEAQDTSPQQWDILRPIIQELQGSNKGMVTLIGDPKQSIYAWREADFRELLSFYEQSDYPENLTENFRSAPEIVRWNNALYSTLASYLEPFLDQKSPKNRRQTTAGSSKTLAVRYIENLYNTATASQTPVQTEWRGKVRVIRLPFTKDQEALKQLRGDELRKILEELKSEGIPPEETAFLVRRNDDIQSLLELLPDHPLQVQQISLGSCASLAVTISSMSGEIDPVKQTYLEQHDFTHLSSTLQSALSAAFTPLEKWQAFYEVAEIWMKKLPEEAPFWKLFLSHLHSFLYRHPMYGPDEIERWWDAKAQHIPLETPPKPGTYPVLTIHKSKGLAWDAVIIPFAEWGLLDVRWPYPKWRLVRREQLPPPLAEAFSGMESLFPSAVPLLLKISAQTDSLKPLYEDYVTEQIIENLNLHYVATTRPRRYLYLLAAEPNPKAHSIKGPYTWRGFWTDPKLSGHLWSDPSPHVSERS
ncbi:MAG: UvrD-helicase domain-containing protein [Bacteroidia bacterium]|nr:UvrD-helicase domain-containing protein [Bacteroidia bacterium]